MSTNLKLPALLVILDGIGIADSRDLGQYDALKQAEAPLLHKLFNFQNNNFATIEASGTAVGLPAGQQGNSEVGHLNIGAGRKVLQELSKIDEAIANGEIARNLLLQNAFAKLIANRGTLHLLGLVSDGGVHSSLVHLKTLIELAVQAGLRSIALHIVTDGRDVDPHSGLQFVQGLQQYVEQNEYPVYVASIAGRYYTMDRDKRYERVQAGYEAIVGACATGDNDVIVRKPALRVVAGKQSIESSWSIAVEHIQSSYASDVTDEFITPQHISGSGVNDGDAILCFNFRPDRARQITECFIRPNYTDFAIKSPPKVDFICLTEYDPNFAGMGAQVLFPKAIVPDTLADVISAHRLRQFHIAETEKYAHVTFFINGGSEVAKTNEARLLVQSPAVATYDLQPEMSAMQVADELTQAIDADAADFYIVNFANGDMVGHTGIMPAAVKAVEAVDAALLQVLESIRKRGGVAVITADHGNAEVMADADGNPITAHSTNKVPLAVLDFTQENKLPILQSDFLNYPLILNKEVEGALADVAPTLLDLIGIELPLSWTGKSLIC